MKTKGWKFLALALVAMATLGLYACGDTVTNVNVEQGVPTPSTAPSVAPSASPVPGQVGAVSSVGVFAFGYENEPGETCTAPPEGARQNGSGQYIVPSGCKLVLTATAFDGNANPIHLPPETPIGWGLSGAGTLTERAPTAFNKEYHRSGAGVAFVTVTLAGKVGTRGFENR